MISKMYNFSLKYAETKELFESSLKEYLGSFNYYPPLDGAMQYSLNAGGKRLRPVLMIECSKMLGLSAKRIMPLAIAIELIHTYSLIHDDLPCMDNDDLRRGKPTNHVVFGQDMAVLAGDGLLNLAMEISLNGIEKDNCESYINAIAKLFASAGPEGMIGGQAIDIINTGKFQSLDNLKTMHRKKTGALFTSACLCPALILDCNNDIIRCLLDYSKYLGLLFQVKDDILDVVGDEGKMGKTIGKDEANNKSTFISLMGIEKSIEYSKEISGKSKESLSAFGEKSEFLSGLVEYILERNN